ncbi:MAG TPA: helix-turn-helix transcriptional regulator [Fibrobacteria bacterium]|nr:helix-turn-helix transcriptional regulator [Fibrobacteria bacterium]
MKKDDKNSTFKGYLEGKLKHKTFREAYEHYRDRLTIGLQIRDLRETAGLTQKRLADRLGVSQQVIARLESGEADNPTVGILERIAKATGHRLHFQFERTRKIASPKRSRVRATTKSAAK